MTSEPPRPAPPAPDAVAQALALVLKAMKDSEPAGDKEDQDMVSSMIHLDRFALRCEVAAEALQLAARTEAALSRRRRNALLPIDRLPSELLSAILIESVNETQFNRTEAFHVLAQVAWRWWMTIKSDPRFWAHITPPMEGVELQIRKAGTLPLSLDWRTGADKIPDVLQRHAERWISIVLKSRPQHVMLQVLCTSPFPRLEYLKVSWEYWKTRGVWRFNLANFQNLREAHLPIVPYHPVSLTSNPPPLLQTLHLDLLPEGSHSFYDLESLLRYTPQLIELEVVNLYDDTSPSSSVDTAIIDLPMLRQLGFFNVVSGAKRDKIPLIAQIRAPLLEKFDLHCCAEHMGPIVNIGGRTTFDELVTRPLASLSRSEDAPLYSALRHVGPSASWTVGVFGGDVRITAKGSGDPEGRLNIHCSTKDDIPRYILQPLATFTLPVDINLGRWGEETKLASWDDMLDAAPLLRSFTLDCPLQVAQQLMDRLSTKAPSPSSANPRAPLLERVRFKNWLSGEASWREGDVGEAVKTMLESRRNLFVQGGVLDPPKLVVTEPSGTVFDEVEGRWVKSDDA